MARLRRGANGWTGLGRLITQRSEVQILPPLRRVALWRRPFPCERAYVVSRRVVAVVVKVDLPWVSGRDAVRGMGRAETGHVARDWHQWVPGLPIFNGGGYSGRVRLCTEAIEESGLECQRLEVGVHAAAFAGVASIPAVCEGAGPLCWEKGL